MTLVCFSCVWAAMVPCVGAGDRPPPLKFDKPGDYVDWLRQHLDEGRRDNAAELYAGLFADSAAGGGFPEPVGTTKERIDALVQGPAWVAQDEPDLVAYLKQCEPGFEVIKAAVQRPQYWFEIPAGVGSMIDVRLPSLISSRSAVKALLVRAWMKQEQAAGSMLEAWELALKHAHQMQDGGTLIHALIGISERALVLQNVRAALSEGVLQGGAVTDTMKIIRTADAGEPDLTRMFTFEWAAVLDTLQYVCPQGRYDTARAKKWAEGFQSQVVSGDFDAVATAKSIDDYYQGLVKLATDPFTRKKLQKLTEYEKKIPELGSANGFLKTVLPSFERPCRLLLRVETERRGALLALALHAYHEEHKKWPTKLTQFAPEEPSDARKDPVSDKPFVYKLEDGKPLLYSVAENGEDDGGRHDPKWGEGDQGGDYVFWPFQRKE